MSKRETAAQALSNAVTLGQVSGLRTAADLLEAAAALGPSLGASPTEVIEDTVAVLRQEAARYEAEVKS